jgi:hypothetical protein
MQNVTKDVQISLLILRRGAVTYETEILALYKLTSANWNCDPCYGVVLFLMRLRLRILLENVGKKLKQVFKLIDVGI